MSEGKKRKEILSEEERDRIRACVYEINRKLSQFQNRLFWPWLRLFPKVRLWRTLACALRNVPFSEVAVPKFDILELPQLGSGFLEAVYQEALEIELQKAEIPYEAQKKLSIFYDGSR